MFQGKTLQDDNPLPQPSRRVLAWRRMQPGDLAPVEAIAAEVHPDYPEGPEVLAERLALYPMGCFLLEIDGQPSGYVISHPWTFGQPPELDSLLGGLPERPDTYYLHDIALLPGARGSGAAALILRQELLVQAQAERLDNLSLVAVGGSHRFWARQGFEEVEDTALATKLASYDADARFMQRRL